MEKTMKNLTALALIIALPFVASAQRQTFNLPAYFATNVFLNDNTNTPLAARISAVEATSTASWATFPATADMNLDGFGATNVAFIGFDTDYTNGIAEGRLQWNTDAEKLEFGLVDGQLTHKIGDATIMRVRAAENILKGQVVSASGQTGAARPNVVLADADSTNLIRRVPTGIALQNINNNASGYILTGGLGDAFNTTAFPTDVPLFLSTTAGALTTNKPGYPLDAWIVGESVLSNAATGQFVVNIAPCKQWAELEARYVNTTNLPAGIVTTNNLSTIAGSGLGVTSNRLVVTNTPTTFEALTGSSFFLGQLVDVAPYKGTTIIDNAIGSFVAGRVEATNTISSGSHGSVQMGSFQRTATVRIETGAVGSQQRGFVNNGGTAIIGSSGSATYGASQFGFIRGTAMITGTAHAAQQRGWFDGAAIINANNSGASQFGLLQSNSTATIEINAMGSIQLLGGAGEGESYITTQGARGSILLGPGTQTNAYGILAAGPIESAVAIRGNHFGNAANLTNFPSSILTVSAGNAAYWRITTAPTGATSSGSSGQMAVSGTNLFIYSPNALGVGTGRWGRVTLDVSW
jgi:hypothetical protein